MPQVFTPGPTDSIKLDLKDVETVRQLKMAMGHSPFMMKFIFGDKADPDFDQRFFEEPVWGQSSTKFARLWIEGFKDANPGISNPEGMFAAPHLYPKAIGVLMVLSTLGYKIPGATPIVDFNALRKLTTFFDETGGDSKKGVVLAPFFSTEEQEGGGTPVKAGTIAVAGLGLLGLVALGLVLGGPKKRRR